MARLKMIDSAKASTGKAYRIGHNTMQWVHDDTRYTQLYNTVVARENLLGGTIAVSAGDHHTKTTCDRLNQVLLPYGFRVGSHRGTWLVRRVRDSKTVEFSDGMVLPDVFDIFN